MSDIKAEDILSDLFIREKRDKLERYRHLNKYVKKGQILFTGSSLMEQFPVNEIAMTYGIDAVIYNRGIGGYTIPEMLDSMDEQIFALEPSGMTRHRLPSMPPPVICAIPCMEVPLKRSLTAL